MKVPETKPTIQEPVLKKHYPTEGLEIGDYTDKGYKVIGKTPDEGIPYIALDERWELMGAVIVDYQTDGSPRYKIDNTAYHRLRDDFNSSAVEAFKEAGGVIR
ncbi:MAG: hypothetical protein ACI4JT_09700 [Oscillospiraceae bacterium]